MSGLGNGVLSKSNDRKKLDRINSAVQIILSVVEHVVPSGEEAIDALMKCSAKIIVLAGVDEDDFKRVVSAYADIIRKEQAPVEPS